jgi:hypothetical protein
MKATYLFKLTFDLLQLPRVQVRKRDLFLGHLAMSVCRNLQLLAGD